MEIGHKINEHILGGETPHLYTGCMRVGRRKPVARLNLFYLTCHKVMPEKRRVTSRNSTFISAGIDQSQHGNLFVSMRIGDYDWQPRAGSVILTY